MSRSLRAIFGVMATASILTGAVGCDKRAASKDTSAPAPRRTNLSGKPTALFLIFGDKGDPRVLPVATLAGGKVVPIQLDAAGWRVFDGMYFREGTRLPVYRDGHTTSDAVVRRGMWEGKDALYKLPGCQALRPLAAATVQGAESAQMPVMLELLGTSAPLAVAPKRADVMPADADSARALADRGAQHAGLTKAQRGELDLNVKAIATGATARPTLLVSWMERNGGAGGKPRHIFLLGDAGATGSYSTSYSYVATDSSPEFRRLLDHVDLTGDGVDEVVLEGWRNAGDSFLVVLGYQNGKWRELARSGTSWCADKT